MILDAPSVLDVAASNSVDLADVFPPRITPMAPYWWTLSTTSNSTNRWDAARRPSPTAPAEASTTCPRQLGDSSRLVRSQLRSTARPASFRARMQLALAGAEWLSLRRQEQWRGAAAPGGGVSPALLPRQTSLQWRRDRCPRVAATMRADLAAIEGLPKISAACGYGEVAARRRPS